MYRSTTISILFITVLISICLTSCGGSGNPINPPPGKYYTWLWCAATKDMYAISTQGWSHNGLDWINVGTGLPNGEQRTYIQFYLPTLPAGVVINEAYINIFENSLQWPGNEFISVGLVPSDWDPGMVTWTSQPYPLGIISSIATIPQFTQINRWKGSENVSGEVQQHLDDPATNHGFVLGVTSPGSVVRSFASVNHATRTSTNLGFAPRLMVKLESSVQLTQNDIQSSGLPNDNELTPRLPGLVTVVDVRFSGNTWPAEWEVAYQ